MQPAYGRMKAAHARTAAFMQGRMQPACSLHASLVWTRHYRQIDWGNNIVKVKVW